MKKLMMLGFLTCPLLAHAYVLPICESDTFSQTIKQKYDSIDCGSHHGLFITENTKNLLGAIDNKGKIIIDNEYEQIDVQDNYPYFYIQKNNLWGVADNKGKILIPPIYTQIQPYHENTGVFVVEKHGKWGIVNQHNQIVQDFNYSRIDAFSDSLASACKNNQCGYLDKNGNTVINFIYQDAYHFNKNYDLALVKNNTSYQFINKQNKAILSFNYKDNIIPDQNIINSFITVNFYDKKSNNEYFGLYNTHGKIILSPIYEYIYYDKEKLPIIVKKDGKYGLYNKNGKKLLDEKYTFIDSYNCGVAQIIQTIGGQEQIGYIDIHGKFVIDFNQKPQLIKTSDALAYLKINSKDKSCQEITSEPMIEIFND